MARKTKEEAERTYYQLLDAAIEEFIERGVAQTTLLQIASRAGLTRGAIYWHFKNKDQLIMALWEYVAGEDMRQFCQQMKAISPDNGAQQFKQLLVMMVQHLSEDVRMQQIIHIISNVMDYSCLDSDIGQYMSAKSEDIFAALTAAITVLKDNNLIKVPHSPQLIASGIFAYFMGLAEMNVARTCGMGHHIELQGNAEQLVDLVTGSWF